MRVEHIRLSQRAKEHLVKLKRDTGITHWNVLCRWAFCTSLSDPSVPPEAEHPADSNVEMDWKTFGGEFADIYWIALVQRCRNDRIPSDLNALAKHFRLHLHRGIAHLAAPGEEKGLRRLLLPSKQVGPNIGAEYEL